MATYYAKKALEILREEGIWTLLSKSAAHITKPINSKSNQLRFNSLKNHLRNRLVYEKPANPYSVIQIQPSEIERKNTSINTRRGLSQVQNGNWDKKRHGFKNVDEVPHISGLEQRILYNKEWEETDYYEYLNNKYDDEYAQQRMKSYEDLYYNIKSNGYKKNHEGHRISHLARDKYIKYKSNARFYDRLEVLVVIDREGQISLRDGRHRFAIARVLKINIPVHVVCRHKKWQELRDRIYTSGLPEEHERLCDHPDLQDVLS